uniref:F-box domain-containing protein n=1 Tax=Mycena chlorophos TaxID=658473 RepID=A0ABQ0M1D1_MYCCL|nr:predicted protein [Mycena chlorophos]
MSSNFPPLQPHHFLQSLPPHDAPSPVASQRAALSQIQDALLRHKAAVLDQLQALRRERQEISSSLAPASLPVLSLPNEITSAIFVACLPEHGRVRPSPSTAPLLVAQICRHWRAVALETTQLWCSMDVETRPLSLTIRGLPPYTEEIERRRLPPSVSLPTFLCRYSARLERLEADVSARQLSQLIPFRIGLSAPNLKHLAGPATDLTNLLKIAPHLETLSLREVPSKNFDQISSATLTTIKFEFRIPIALSSFLDLISRCPSLESFTGDLKITPECNTRCSGRVGIATKLSTFDVRLYQSHSEIFDFLQLPALHTLTFAMSSSAAATVPILNAFLLRSGCRVTTLGIWASHFRNGMSLTHSREVAECLRPFQSVECLSVHGISFEEYFPDPSGTWNAFTTMPFLRELVLSGEAPEFLQLDYCKIIKLVGHRVTELSLPPLHKFTLCISDERRSSYEDMWFPSRLQATKLRRLVSEFAVQLSTYFEDTGTTTETCWPSEVESKSDPYASFRLNQDDDDDGYGMEVYYDDYDSDGAGSQCSECGGYQHVRYT